MKLEVKLFLNDKELGSLDMSNMWINSFHKEDLRVYRQETIPPFLIGVSLDVPKKIWEKMLKGDTT